MASRATTHATPKASETRRSEAPDTRETSGRAITVRSTNSPIADMIATKTSQRNASNPGVTADSLSEGTTNCGGGPGLGPTANVNAPRTGCPSAEIARQKTRYQPSGTRFSGVRIVSGFAGDRCGRAVVSCVPLASVTETTMNRGSTASS